MQYLLVIWCPYCIYSIRFQSLLFLDEYARRKSQEQNDRKSHTSKVGAFYFSSVSVSFFSKGDYINLSFEYFI